MADLTKMIKVVFQGDDKISGALVGVSGNLNNFADRVQSVTGPMADLGKSILMTEAALISLTAAGIGYAVKEFANFEDVMLKNSGILRATPAEYEMLTEKVMALGKETRYTAQEAAEGLQFLAMAGMETNTAIGALPTVLQMAQAANIGLGDTADIVTNIMAGYKIQVEDLGRASDTLVAGFTSSNTSLQQLGQAFKYVGPVAAELGLPLEETTAILGKLGDAGYQADMGGTALRNILVTLIAPAGNAGKMFEKLGVDTAELGINLASSRTALDSLGVSVKDSDGNMKPFTEILESLKAGLDKLPSSADRAGVLMEIFGKRGGPQMQALLSQGVESISNLQEKIKGLEGVTQDLAEKMESGVGGALRALNSALDSIALSIGKKAGQEIAPAVQGLTGIFRVFSTEISKGAFDPLFEAIGSFSDRITVVFQAIATNLPEALKGIDFDRLITSFGNLENSIKNAFAAFFGDIDLTTVEGLQDAIQKTIDSFAALTNTAAGVIEGLVPFLKLLGSLVEKFRESESAQRSLGVSLGTAMGIDKIMNAVKLFTVALTALSSAMSVLAITQIPTFISSVGSLGAAFASNAAGGIASMTTGITNLVRVLGPAGLAGALGYTIGSLMNQTEAVQNAAQYWIRLADDILDFSGKKKEAREQIEANILAIRAETEVIKTEAQAIQQQIDDFGKREAPVKKPFEAIYAEILKIKPELKEALDLTVKTNWGDKTKITEEGRQQLMDILEALKAQAAGYPVTHPLITKLDEEAKNKVKDELVQEIVGWKEDAEGNKIPIYAAWDQASIKEALDEKPGIEKELELKAKIDLEKLKLDAENALERIKETEETLRAGIEIQANIDIAKLEAQAEQAKAIGESISETFESTGEAISSIAGDLSSLDEGDSYMRMKLLEALEKEQEIRREQHDMQMKILELEAKNIELRNKKLEQADDKEIKINMDGVEPDLEMVMWRIINKVHVRANEVLADFLLGVPVTA